VELEKRNKGADEDGRKRKKVLFEWLEKRREHRPEVGR
jgi:hypothetical protein